MDGVFGQSEIYRAFDKAPHVPTAGASAASAFNGKLQADSLLLDDALALRAMDILIPVRA